MRRIEQEHIAQLIVIPRLNEQRSELTADQQICITAKVSSLPRSKKYDSAIEHILKFMPALSAYVEMLTVSGYNTNRKDSANDFFDRELIVYGLSYSSVFAAVDRGITELIELSRKSGFPGSFGHVGSLSALKSNVEHIAL